MNKGNLEENIYVFPPRFFRYFFVIASISLMVFIIYGNTFESEFNFDDEENIVENKSIHLKEITADNLLKILDYNPARAVAMFSFALNYYFHDLHVWGYHFFNCIVHIFAGLFLFLFVFETLNLPVLQPRYGKHSYPIALLATFLWLTHPIQTQAVTYIVQRMASMSAMFYICSMYLYVKWRFSNHPVQKKMLALFSILAGMFSVFTKENAIMLPFSILLYEFILLQKISKADLQRVIKILLIFFSVVVFLGTVIAFIHDYSPKSIFKGYDIRPFTLIQRFLTESRIIWFYVSLLLYPTSDRLTIGHDIFISQSLINPPTTIFSILLIILFILLSVCWFKKYPLMIFCILFFFLNHVVESTIIPLELIFEHRNYLPSMMFFLPISIALVKMFEYFSQKKTMSFFIGFFIIGLLVGQGVSTYIRNFTWQTEMSLWRDAVEKAPTSSRNHVNLAVEYQKKGMLQAAIIHAERAIELNRHVRLEYEFYPYSLLGDFYKSMNQTEKAIHYYLEADRIKPYFVTQNNLATAYLQTGNIEKARQHLLKSLSMEKSAKTYNNLAYVYLVKKQIDEAILFLKKSLKLNPGLIQANINMGAAYKMIGDYTLAKVYYKIAATNLTEDNFLNILTYLGLLELYALTEDKEKNKTADYIVHSLLLDFKTMEVFLNKIDDPSSYYRNLFDMRIVLEELGKSFFRHGESTQERGSLFFEKAEEIGTGSV